MKKKRWDEKTYTAKKPESVEREAGTWSKGAKAGGGDKGEKNMKKNDGKKKNPLDVKGEKQVGKTAEEGWWF